MNNSYRSARTIRLSFGFVNQVVSWVIVHSVLDRTLSSSDSDPAPTSHLLSDPAPGYL
jgi:regulatory protein YycH of two-component signal transduction system YycFG